MEIEFHYLTPPDCRLKTPANYNDYERSKIFWFATGMKWAVWLATLCENDVSRTFALCSYKIIRVYSCVQALIYLAPYGYHLVDVERTRKMHFCIVFWFELALKSTLVCCSLGGQGLQPSYFFQVCKLINFFLISRDYRRHVGF